MLGLLNGATRSELCEGVQLDAQVKLETEDGTRSYETSFLTSNALRYELGGRAIDSDGRELQIISKASAGRNLAPALRSRAL